jgi:hypothetical protein
VLLRAWSPPLIALWWLLAAGAAAGAEPSKEIQARKAFVEGQFEKAADLFADLYAETLHPVYLRNLARCYQKLGQPDKAIGLFRDYLGKGRSISADERREVEAYIAEMEQLRERSRGAPATGGERALPRAPREPAPDQRLVARPMNEGLPLYRRWWFWTALGVAAAGGVAAVVLSRPSALGRPPCPTECFGP